MGFQQTLDKKYIYMYYRKLLLSNYNGYYRERLRNNKVEIIIYSKKIYEVVRDVKKNPIKHLYENPIEFIAGFTDGDGSIMGNEIAIYDYNRKLLEEVCIFLENNSIHCKVKPCKNIWRIRIRDKNSIKKFLALIPVLTRI